MTDTTETLEALRVHIEALKDILRKVEWVGTTEVFEMMEWCPVCGGSYPKHNKNCDLQEAIKESE